MGSQRVGYFLVTRHTHTLLFHTMPLHFVHLASMQKPIIYLFTYLFIYLFDWVRSWLHHMGSSVAVHRLSCSGLWVLLVVAPGPWSVQA